MKINFKLLEIASNIFSKSNQLKDLYITSLTEGFNLKINIYESISNNLSYTINYKGVSKKIKICLLKGKANIGFGQIIISNKKQNIEIFPENKKSTAKKIKLTILCCNNYMNKNKMNDKLLKSPDKTSSNNNNFNNSNTNNTSTLSISSCVNHVIQNRIKSTPINKIITKNTKGCNRNKSQHNLNDDSNKKLYIGLRQKNNYMHDKINDNTSLFSERTKKHLSGNVSLNSYFSENSRKIKKKIFSPKISLNSHPIYKESLNSINNKRRNKNNSMIITYDKRNKINDNIFRFSSDINMEKINSQIENYIIDKSYEDELQNDDPIIYPQEKINYLSNNINNKFNNENKFEQLLNDFLLLYNNDNIKNFEMNEIVLEFHFLVEKIYELINEYYKEYYSLFNQNNSLINNIKYFSYQYIIIIKAESILKIRINKESFKNDLNKKVKDDKYYSNNIKKLTSELNIMKNINIGLINQNIKKESSKKLLKDLFTNIINKNKSYLDEKQINKLKQINIRININEENKTNKNKNKQINYLNKRIFNHNASNKYQNAKKKTYSDNISKKSKRNSKSRDKNSNKLFENSIYKIKVKTKNIFQ